MIERASVAIGQLTEHERKQRQRKYFRRNRMHYIDKLLNELEMLNLADQNNLPQPLSVALDRLVEESAVEGSFEKKPATVVAAMDVLYEIQDSLMFNEDDDEV
jgi:hypothetical protein